MTYLSEQPPAAPLVGRECRCSWASYTALSWAGAGSLGAAPSPWQLSVELGIRGNAHSSGNGFRKLIGAAFLLCGPRALMALECETHRLSLLLFLSLPLFDPTDFEENPVRL